VPEEGRAGKAERGEKFKNHAVQPPEVKLKRLGLFSLEKGDDGEGSRTGIYSYECRGVAEEGTVHRFSKCKIKRYLNKVLGCLKPARSIFPYAAIKCTELISEGYV